MIKINGNVHVKHIRKGKLLLDKDLGHNLVTNAGKAAVAGLIGNTGGITAFTYIALGSSATAVSVSDTTLTAEISSNGLSRQVATISRITTSVTNDTIQFTYTFTATGAQTVNELGILNASSSGILLSHKLTGTISLSSTDQLIITYTIQLT